MHVNYYNWRLQQFINNYFDRVLSYIILLGGDISRNPGPGYRNMEEIKKARGLKIAHLNIRSL